MSGEENRHRYGSSIPRPAGTSLYDITPSANNALNIGMPPPGPMTSKKSLSDRAGDPRITKIKTKTSRVPSRSDNGPLSSHTRIYQPNSGIKPLGKLRGPNPAARSLPRPHTSIGHVRQDKISPPLSRAPTEASDGDSGRQLLGKRNGANTFPSPAQSSPLSTSSSSPTFQKQDQRLCPGSYDNQTSYICDWSSSLPLPTPASSLCTALDHLSINPNPTKIEDSEANLSNTPGSKLPRLMSPPTINITPKSPMPHSHKHSLLHSPKKISPKKLRPFLTKYSQVRDGVDEDWDTVRKLEGVDKLANRLMEQLAANKDVSAGVKEALDLYKTQVNNLEEREKKLTDEKVELRIELGTLKAQLSNAESKTEEAAREHEIAIGNLASQHRTQIETSRQESWTQIQASKSQHQVELAEAKRRFEEELEGERGRRTRDIQELNVQLALAAQNGQLGIENKERELQNLVSQVQRLEGDVEKERMLNKELQQTLLSSSGHTVKLESSILALKARIEFLESGNKEQSEAFARLNQELNDALVETHAATERLRKEETMRRNLHNQIQELRGNIRVFCRVRPLLSANIPHASAEILYPDADMHRRELTIKGPEEKSSLGTISTKNHEFSFDHVFGQLSSNSEIFSEISQLVQSALDGFNVCIFCYGQTGSGKTYTMSSEDGMISRALRQIYTTTTELRSMGWEYTMEGNFIEVYNENIHDLLGKPDDFDKKKHEIRHDLQKRQTSVTNAITVNLDSQDMVESLLLRASTNRSVAATNANERSSRSHSVFMLRIFGKNSISGEYSEGTLNLVDLAGSERLSHSGSTGERLKETQNINRSLSCLGDVIAALAQGKEGAHIPYRNSKLTYLLQYSLGGNSKTLMFVMVSPLQEHLNETLSSLKFAAKVHNTHIGTAKRQSKICNA
ncbi:kinesin-like nuclear fusion protein [Myotisia sp. PD_48]|nr:kinesin-like nuclear fusion protein [Myotisia sp. PD_48]